MRWSEWMRSQVVTRVASALLSLSLGTPPALAVPSSVWTDELRAISTKDSPAEAQLLDELASAYARLGAVDRAVIDPLDERQAVREVLAQVYLRERASNEGLVILMTFGLDEALARALLVSVQRPTGMAGSARSSVPEGRGEAWADLEPLVGGITGTNNNRVAVELVSVQEPGVELRSRFIDEAGRRVQTTIEIRIGPDVTPDDVIETVLFAQHDPTAFSLNVRGFVEQAFRRFIQERIPRLPLSAQAGVAEADLLGLIVEQTIQRQRELSTQTAQVLEPTERMRQSLQEILAGLSQDPTAAPRASLLRLREAGLDHSLAMVAVLQAHRLREVLPREGSVYARLLPVDRTLIRLIDPRARAYVFEVLAQFFSEDVAEPANPIDGAISRLVVSGVDRSAALHVVLAGQQLKRLSEDARVEFRSLIQRALAALPAEAGDQDVITVYGTLLDVFENSYRRALRPEEQERAVARLTAAHLADPFTQDLVAEAAQAAATIRSARGTPEGVQQPPPPLMWASDEGALYIDEHGGKVANSAKMLQGGLDVPGFFFLTNTALQQFYELNPEVLELARELVFGVDADEEVSAGEVENRIKSAFARGTLPVELQTTLEAWFRELARQEGYTDAEINRFLVAVRISAKLEDLPSVPAAGINDTDTNVRLATLFDHVLQLWGSLFNRRAIAYRDKTALFFWLSQIDRSQLDQVAELLERALEDEETMEIPGRVSRVPKERLLRRLRRIAETEEVRQLKLDEVYISTKQLFRIFDLISAVPDGEGLAQGLRDSLQVQIDQFVDPQHVGADAMVQVMRQSEVSIVAFSTNKASGWTGYVNGLDVVVFEASYGLGEYVVEGKIIPDTFLVVRRMQDDGHYEYVILDKILGTKERKMVLDPDTGEEIELEVPEEDRRRFALTDEQILEVAQKTFDAREVLNQGRDGQAAPAPVDTEALYYVDGSGNLAYNIVQMRDVKLFRGFDFENPDVMELVRTVIEAAARRRALAENRLAAKGFATSGAAAGRTVWVEDVEPVRVQGALRRVADGEGRDVLLDVIPVEHRDDLFSAAELQVQVVRAQRERQFARSGVVEAARGLARDEVQHIQIASRAAADADAAQETLTEERLRAIVRFLYEAAPTDVDQRERLLLTLYRSMVQDNDLADELLNEHAAGLARLILNQQFAKVQAMVDAGEDVILLAPVTNPNYNEMMAKVAGTVTLQGGETSHAIVIAGQWGYTVVGGAKFDREALRQDPNLIRRMREGLEVTIDGNTGHVFLGRLPIEEESLLYQPTRWADYGTAVGLISAAAVEGERATLLGRYAADYGDSLARVEDFVIAEVGVNGRAAYAYDRLQARLAGELDESALNVQQLADLERMASSLETQQEFVEKGVHAYGSATDYFRFKLSRLFLRKMATKTPVQGIQVRALDLKKNEQVAHSAGAPLFFNEERASMLGDRGTPLEMRVVETTLDGHPVEIMENVEGFDIQLMAISDAKEDAKRLGNLAKVGFMLVFGRTTQDIQRALDRIESLYREGRITELPDDVGVMFELTINAIFADKLAGILAEWRDHMRDAYGVEISTYFSHGTNDGTQSALGSDRDEDRYVEQAVYLPRASEPVTVRVFDEGDPAVYANIVHGIAAAHRNGIKCGLCGQAMINLINRGTLEALAAAANIVVELDSVGTDVRNYGRTVQLIAHAQLAVQSVPPDYAINPRNRLLNGRSLGRGGAATRRLVMINTLDDLWHEVGGRRVPHVVEGDLMVIRQGLNSNDEQLRAAITRASGVIVSGREEQDRLVEYLVEQRKPVILTDVELHEHTSDGIRRLSLGNLRNESRYTVDFHRGMVFPQDAPVVRAELLDNTAYQRINEDAHPATMPVVYVSMDEVYRDIGMHPLALAAFAFDPPAWIGTSRTEIADPVSAGKIESVLTEKEILGEIRQEVVDEVGRLLLRRDVQSVTALIEQSFLKVLTEKTLGMAEDVTVVVETSQEDTDFFRGLEFGERFDVPVANAPIAFRGLLKTISPGYDEIFKMFLNVYHRQTQVGGRRRRMPIQLNYVQNPRVLELALEFLRRQGLVPGEQGLQVGMNIATPAHFINAEDFFEQGIGFITIDERLLLMNIALADPENQVMLYDGRMVPLVDPETPEFVEALKIATQIVKTAAEEHNVRLTVPVEPTGAFPTATEAPAISPAAPAPITPLPTPGPMLPSVSPADEAIARGVGLDPRSPETRLKLESLLGTFPTVRLASLEDLYAQVGGGQIRLEEIMERLSYGTLEAILVGPVEDVDPQDPQKGGRAHLVITGHYDRPGLLLAVTRAIAEQGVNIRSLDVGEREPVNIRLEVEGIKLAGVNDFLAFIKMIPDVRIPASEWVRGEVVTLTIANVPNQSGALSRMLQTLWELDPRINLGRNVSATVRGQSVSFTFELELPQGTQSQRVQDALEQAAQSLRERGQAIQPGAPGSTGVGPGAFEAVPGEQPPGYHPVPVVGGPLPLIGSALPDDSSRPGGAGPSDEAFSSDQGQTPTSPSFASAPSFTTLDDVDVAGKRVLVRVDFNVPMQGRQVSDATRIEEALPTIQYLLAQGAKVILASHLGRPRGKVVPELSLRVVAGKLQELLPEATVHFGGDIVEYKAGAPAKLEVFEELRPFTEQMQPGAILVLENTRFHPEEEIDIEDPSDPDFERAEAFAEQLASLAEVYVQDGFGVAHRENVSVARVAKFFQTKAAGLLMAKELRELSKALTPQRPFMVLLGGAKVSDKIGVITNLLEQMQAGDALLIGGGMAYTFMRAQDQPVGRSLVEEDRLEIALEILRRVAARGVEVVLPVDHIVADNVDHPTQVMEGAEIPDGLMGLDIGPQTVERFGEVIGRARMVLWNGPVGAGDRNVRFAQGTTALAQQLAEATDHGVTTIIGGGDTVAAVAQAGFKGRMTHESTGGGASLEFLEGKTLPGVAALLQPAAGASAIAAEPVPSAEAPGLSIAGSGGPVDEDTLPDDRREGGRGPAAADRERAHAPVVTRAVTVEDVWAGARAVTERVIAQDGTTRLRVPDDQRQAAIDYLVGLANRRDRLTDQDGEVKTTIEWLSQALTQSGLSSIPPLALARVLAREEATFTADESGQPTYDPGTVTTNSIAVVMHAGYRGEGMERVDEAAQQAQFVSAAITADQGLRAKRVPSGEVVNPQGFGEEVAVIEAIVGDAALVTNNGGISRADQLPSESGAAFIRAAGQGVETLGDLPDVFVYPLIVTQVPTEKRAEVQAALDPSLDSREGMERTLTTIAEANNLTLNDLEIVVTERWLDRRRRDVLGQLQQAYPDLAITRVPDRLVEPGVLAALGRKAKAGKHLVVMTEAADATEGLFNLAVARTQQGRGAVAALRTSDGRILRPDDVSGPVEASMAFITDSGWFGLPGVSSVTDGVSSRILSLRFSDPEGTGQGTARVDVEDLNHGAVDRLISRGTFALQEPAAADPAVVDQENRLLRLMEDAAHPQIVRVHQEIAGHAPGFFIAWERALERFRRQRGLATLDEAANQSALKVEVFLEQEVEVVDRSLEHPGLQEASVVLPVNEAADVPWLVGQFVQQGVFPGIHVSATTPERQAVEIKFTGLSEGTDQVVQAAQHFLLTHFIETLNAASKGATQLRPQWFSVATKETPGRPAAMAIGPTDWLKTVTGEASVKIAFDPVEEQVRSGAAALHVGAIAAAGEDPQDPAVAAKLEQLGAVLGPDLITIGTLDVDRRIEQAVDLFRHYQQTIEAAL